jgi:hypothetical protein
LFFLVFLYTVKAQNNKAPALAENVCTKLIGMVPAAASGGIRR